MYKSCQPSDFWTLDDERFEKLVQAMSHTKVSQLLLFIMLIYVHSEYDLQQLKQSLKSIYLDEQSYEAEEKQQIFDKLGFDLKF